jgi:NADPH:quinone reductase
MEPIPGTMRAIVADGQGGPEVLKLLERPVPQPMEGEILVRVRFAGVNRPDVIQRQGGYPPPPGAPDILGLEIAGEVVAQGQGAKRFGLGAKVMALVAGGGYADYAMVHESNALPVPEGLSLEQAGAVPETYFTVWTNVFERGALKEGETLLVHGGTSGIGTTAIQLAKAFGAKVIATAGSAQKCEACLQLGADVAVDYRNHDFVAAVKEATGGKGADVILDMVGGDYIPRNHEAAAQDGASSRSPS